jgi:anthranilate synthase/aminodeoxychorismate synthase-like glutamine amidotransferase
MLLLIDNYDSFTYNLAQYFQILNQTVVIYKNDAIDLATIERLAPSHIVISPGPNSPNESGISMDIIRHFHHNIPLLGVCLGHQCIAHAFGANITTAPEIMHGKTSCITHHQANLFKNIPPLFNATRYHSLMVECCSLPSCFTIDAWANNIIMAITHRDYPLFGIQFHPESILTEHGFTLLKNFLNDSADKGRKLLKYDLSF